MRIFVSALTRYCLDCGIKHLVIDCDLNPDKKGKATLNLLETIPSASSNESDESKHKVTPVNVMTRAQAQKQAAQPTEEGRTEKSSPDSWKARRQRRVATKKERE